MISTHTSGQLTILTAGAILLDKDAENRVKKESKGGRPSRPVQKRGISTEELKKMTPEQYEAYMSRAMDTPIR